MAFTIEKEKGMLKGIFQLSGVVLVGLTLVGCGGGIAARSYVATKERVDQELEGNGGYLMGTPPADSGDRRKTRKVYVFEMTSVAQDPTAATTSSSPAATSAPAVAQEESDRLEPASVAQRRQNIQAYEEAAAPIVIPPIDDVQVEPSAPSFAGTNYTIEKNDTLQKISKKFYNSYSKWPKIYEANKERIKNPNVLKPGTEIVIPSL